MVSPLQFVGVTSDEYTVREWSLPSYAPPRLSDDTTLNSTWHTGWVVLYLDVSSEVLLVHMGTAAVREAPWISLRTSEGVVFFANLVYVPSVLVVFDPPASSHVLPGSATVCALVGTF